MQPQDIATVETDLFNHREVKPHFINECCFGEDFAAWLRDRVSDLAGFGFSEPIQEDYGWGFWANYGKQSFWVALSYVGWGPTEAPGQWVVCFACDPGLNLFKRIFTKPDLSAMETLRARIRKELETKEGIRIVQDAF
ncbi:MAG TPA: hypothetical protein VNZ22_21895 [Bacillota bacterium]|nr:hypothetical protein [Bacillota bacterium]